jgi:hypothetical protein
MGGRVAVAATALRTMQLQRVMERLVQRGVLQIAAFTPTDAAHVVGLQNTYDASAARKAATLFARRRDRLGKAIAAVGAGRFTSFRDLAIINRQITEATYATIDAIGDVLVTIIILSYQLELNPWDCLESAYNEIKERKGQTIDGVFIKE